MEKDIKKSVREGYGRIAKGSTGSCCASCGEQAPSCGTSGKIGYSPGELKSLPAGADLGLGCGNPVAFASLREGETVLDLGSGAGIDCLIAADRVGPAGKVIGVDMTPEMVERAAANAARGDYRNVEFRLGEIEDLPVADGTVDAVISNCVINLVPDKGRAFEEVFRVLRPGGRLMISDIVLLGELPEAIKKSVKAYVGCLSGAVSRENCLKHIADAGFREARIIKETSFPIECMSNDPTAKALAETLRLRPGEIEEAVRAVASITVSAVKP